MGNVIELNGLTKYYGKHKGIEDITFSVEEGEVFGFIGPNGAGKSTTIRTLLALIHPTGGSATIFGKDCIKEAASIAADVGYLPSETYYYEEMKVKDILNYSQALYKKDCKKKIVDMADRLNLDMNRKIRDLSLGNKKKVGIIQGLLHSPKLIILDEPTSGLDPLMQQTFFEMLKEENENGASVLFSSHILSEVQKMCNRVAILKDGKLKRIQDIQELRENGYKKVNLTAKQEIDKAYFDIKGITNAEIHDNTAQFLFQGDINQMVARLHELQLIDVTMEEPTLEEIFLHYYE